MDSSGSSLDLTAAVENPSREVADFASRSVEYHAALPVVLRCTCARCKRICILVGDAGVGRKFDGEAGNVGIKGDASDHTPGACAYPGILRGRILARLRIRRTKRLNKTRRPKLKILMLDSTGLACASRACKGCNGLSGGSPCRSPCGTFSMFVLMPGDNLVDSWCRSRSLGVFYFNLPPAVSHNQLWDNLALCSHGIRGILGMLSQNLKVERNPEAGWIVVKESAGCVDLQGDLLVYPFDSKSSSPGRLLLIPR
ncbi:hypothetical protein YC2023_023824 [Brassica napus]